MLAVAVAPQDDNYLYKITLIRAARRWAARTNVDFLVLGFAAGNPMLARLRTAFPAHVLRSNLYLVYPSAAPLHAIHLDGSVPHVEVAIL